MLDYGIRLGAVGATAAAMGFAFHFDHVGWACAAALLVMRPSAEMQRLRSVGRVLAVTAGAAAAAAIATVTSAPGWYCLVALTAVAGAAATRGSRWYVTPAFTTLLAISMLIYSHPQDAGSRFGERVGETILGVTIAYLFGLLLPRLLHAGVTENPRSRRRVSHEARVMAVLPAVMERETAPEPRSGSLTPTRTDRPDPPRTTARRADPACSPAPERQPCYGGHRSRRYLSAGRARSPAGHGEGESVAYQSFRTECLSMSPVRRTASRSNPVGVLPRRHRKT